MLDLPALKKLCEAATPGPWCMQIEDTPSETVWLDQNGLKPPKLRDLDFIDAARTAVPQLIEAYECVEKHAAFGWQCYQDRCEGAFVEASVVKKLDKENAALKAEVEELKKFQVGHSIRDAYYEMEKENQALHKLVKAAAAHIVALERR